MQMLDDTSMTDQFRPREGKAVDAGKDCYRLHPSETLSKLFTQQ